jgi:hypothetical protein
MINGIFFHLCKEGLYLNVYSGPDFTLITDRILKGLLLVSAFVTSGFILKERERRKGLSFILFKYLK